MKDESEKSLSNLCEDLGLKAAEEIQAKAVFARTIDRILKERKLSQSKAAELLDISQPALSRLLQGKIAGFSIDRLLRILNQLGQDVEIKIKPAKTSRSVGRTLVSDFEDFRSLVSAAGKGKDTES